MEKKCLNPSCGKTYKCGHYQNRQKVCSGWTWASCRSCHGTGKKDGEKCKKCAGTGKLKQTCKDWYKLYWAQVKHPPRGIPDKDYKRILEEAKKAEGVPFWSLLVVARECGKRKGELLGITWGDVIGPDGKIKNTATIRGQYADGEGFAPTKTGKASTAFFTALARKALATLPRGKAADRIWPFWESETWRKFVRIQKRLKIMNPETGQPFRFHDIRHSVGHYYAAVKKDIKLAQQILGHSNVNTTMNYAEQTDAEILKKMEH
jgi:integrase